MYEEIELILNEALNKAMCIDNIQADSNSIADFVINFLVDRKLPDEVDEPEDKVSSVTLKLEMINMMRVFLDSIRDYENENKEGIYKDERGSEDFVITFVESEDGFNFGNIVKMFDEPKNEYENYLLVGRNKDSEIMEVNKNGFSLIEIIGICEYLQKTTVLQIEEIKSSGEKICFKCGRKSEHDIFTNIAGEEYCNRDCVEIVLNAII